MSAQEKVDESALRVLATAETFSRGEEYYGNGAVSDLQRRGETLLARVAGSQYEPYRVTVEFGEGGIVSARCTCPYDWGGYCKHIVATLLTYVRDPEQVEERPTVETLLAGLDAELLRDLLGDLLAGHPDLIDWAEGRLAIRQQPAPAPAKAVEAPAAPAAPRPRPVPIDANAIRRQARSMLRVSGGYYAASGAVGGLNDTLAQARQALAAGDGENALAIVSIIAEETIPGWEEFDDSDEEFGEWFSVLGQVFTEALLTADLPRAERQDWARKLAKWQAELDDYGVDEAFDAAIAAAEQGWDYEPLRRAMAGDITARGAWSDETPWFADSLTTARLNVLERRGRFAEYLNLAQAEGETERYVTMLVKAGRWQEAVDYGLENLGTPEEVLALAKALQEQGEVRAALQIGEHGLGMPGNSLNALAHWLRDTAAALGERDLALRAGRVAFDTSVSLADYQAVQAVAGETWPALRPELLQRVAQQPSAWEAVDIYLYEGLVDDAIKLVDGQPYVHYSAVEKVVDAAWRTHPDWAIRQARGQAEPIMDQAKSKYYGQAVRWLGKAKQAYLAAGREADWWVYCESLIAKHGRKHSLVPQLKDLLKTPRPG